MIQFNTDSLLYDDDNLALKVEKDNNHQKIIEKPRSRTTSERFHCHTGNLEESDDNISGIAGSDRNTRSNPTANHKAIRVLWLSVIVCLIFMLCEVVGGIWAQSLAIITDAAHLVNFFFVK